MRHSICTVPREKGITSMDFGVVIFIANGLLAACIYVILSWLWQE